MTQTQELNNDCLLAIIDQCDVVTGLRLLSMMTYPPVSLSVFFRRRIMKEDCDMKFMRKFTYEHEIDGRRIPSMGMTPKELDNYYRKK